MIWVVACDLPAQALIKRTCFRHYFGIPALFSTLPPKNGWFFPHSVSLVVRSRHAQLRFQMFSGVPCLWLRRSSKRTCQSVLNFWPFFKSQLNKGCHPTVPPHPNLHAESTSTMQMNVRIPPKPTGWTRVQTPDWYCWLTTKVDLLSSYTIINQLIDHHLASLLRPQWPIINQQKIQLFIIDFPFEGFNVVNQCFIMFTNVLKTMISTYQYFSVLKDEGATQIHVIPKTHQ